MSGNEVDYYDVERMIRDARYDHDREINRELAEIKNTLRQEVEELRAELESISRVLQSRTSHLV